MKIAAITPRCYPDHQPISMLLESARAHKWRIDPYGVQGVDKRSLLLYALCKAKSDGYTHVLYLEGEYSLAIANQKEMLEKYSRLGSPPLLMSAGIGPSRPSTTPWNYPSNGQWLGEVGSAIHMVESTGGNSLVLDRWCDIFQNMDAPLLFNGKESLVIRKGRVLNKITGTFPCFLHFSGQKEMMKPWWDKLKP